MIRIHRRTGAALALSILLGVGCQAQSQSQTPPPPEPEAPVSEGPAVEQPEHAAQLEAEPGGGRPGAGPGHDCGPMVSPPGDGCSRSGWFCNSTGECHCKVPPSAVTDEVAAPPGALARDARGAAPAGGASESRGTAARPVGPGAAGGAHEATTGEPGSSCAGASVSAPRGDCAASDWFCNASGLCRCRA